ncbi:DUF368 domain-containing protein [Aeoliella sp. ICT_H6.2]|uniref:DUF368 domain-containing protein n=1 Tax=Aeoliella straminimaris TaxID=2954799 RepID=A0A9X2F6N3_9BACT|nr:DUF368 domain-containing protein [Aeoliella straminimaris]MCO6042633.1 DUF368 domain-containing protein [Aeoliella straminimaris]
MSNRRFLAVDLPNAARGLLMGAADIIPGVSGGTVALLLGIYPRLLTAISHVDGQFLGYLRQGQWRDAAKHLDLRFLVALAVGILTGVVTLAGLLHFLLQDYRELTLAAFFGLILASSVIVLRMIKPTSKQQTVNCWLTGIVAAGFAAWLVQSAYLEPREGLLYVFICGAIAICAMILPGISGAYILVLLGKYEDITGILHRLKALDATGDDLWTLVVFAAGCVVGLLTFSKVLKALLVRQYNPTMAVLGGFMLGSLVKVWPFQKPPAGVTEITKTTITHPYWPEPIDSQVIWCAVIAVVAFAIVVAADHFAQRSSSEDHEQATKA